MQASNMEADTPSSHALQNSGTALGLTPSVSGNGFYVTSPDAQTSNVEPSLQAWLYSSQHLSYTADCCLQVGRIRRY